MSKKENMYKKYDVDRFLHMVKKAEGEFALGMHLDCWVQAELDKFKYLVYMEQFIPDIRKHFESSAN